MFTVVSSGLSPASGTLEPGRPQGRVPVPAFPGGSLPQALALSGAGPVSSLPRNCPRISEARVSRETAPPGSQALSDGSARVGAWGHSGQVDAAVATTKLTPPSPKEGAWQLGVPKGGSVLSMSVAVGEPPGGLAGTPFSALTEVAGCRATAPPGVSRPGGGATPSVSFEGQRLGTPLLGEWASEVSGHCSPQDFVLRSSPGAD